MNRHIALLSLTLLLGAATAQAKDKPLPGDGDYRKALPFLDKAAEQIAGMEKAREAGKSPAEAAKPFSATLSKNLNQAIPLLNQAAAQKHPVAEYRLAQVLADFAQDAKSQQRACELLGDSLKQGFAPAALELETLCPEQAKRAQFLQQAEAAARSGRYAKYFPQPSHALGWCSAKREMTLNATLGGLRDYQADIYLMLSTKVPAAKRDGYRQRAAEKGCALAQPSQPAN
ncbi:hypothetical protein [Pseudomonas panipatensis]|uniref:hypothetical protein n=1 Tax=Pseudomonas panipatensis TaxID=428992 RepID=UPI0035B26DD4